MGPCGLMIFTRVYLFVIEYTFTVQLPTGVNAYIPRGFLMPLLTLRKFLLFSHHFWLQTRSDAPQLHVADKAFSIAGSCAWNACHLT